MGKYNFRIPRDSYHKIEMHIWKGQLQFESCYPLNEVDSSMLEKAEDFLNSISEDDKRPFEMLLRVVAAAVWSQSKSNNMSQEGIRTALLSPFVYKTDASETDIDEHCMSIVQHTAVSTADPILSEIYTNPYKFPVGFFVCNDVLVPYCASSCQLNICTHIPEAVKSALKTKEALKCKHQKGRLLVSNNGVVVWRSLEKDQQLDDETKHWINESTDCLVVTYLDEHHKTSYLIAEPFID